MEWISVKDRLPEDDIIILVLSEICIPEDNYLKQKKGYWIFEGKFNRMFGWFIYFHPENLQKITHWMPLPELPK